MTLKAIRFSALCVFLLPAVNALAQQPEPVTLIRSGEVIEAATILHDSGRYEDAVKKYLSVPEQDTNYVYMLTELALSYDAMKEYDKAIATCQKVLAVPSIYRAHIYRQLGTTYDHMGEKAKSIKTYEEALALFPFDASLHYNLGVTYYNAEEYDKAEACFIRALRVNPFHGSSHLNLGRLSAFRGDKVRAMMSLGVYMTLAEKDNPRLVFLEKFLNNEIPDEGTFPSSGPEPFDKLDQIIKAKIVTDKNFKPVVDVNAILVRQYQLMLEQLNRVEEQPGDFWIEFYLPFYKGIRDRQMLEPFLYHLLTSTNFESVAKWKKKNEKRLTEFYGMGNQVLGVINDMLTPPKEWGYAKPVPAWYDKGKLESIGEKNADGKAIGPWRFFHTNGEIQAIGSFDDKGTKTGTWTYFHNTGLKKSNEVYQGTRTVIDFFNEAGQPLNHYTLVDGEVEGEVEILRPCGLVSEKLNYKAGKREGPGETFFVDGQVSRKYTMKDNEYEGEIINYFPDGKVLSRYSTSAGKAVGPFISYRPNGKVKSKGIYTDDMSDGMWLYYHIAGRLEKEGNYKLDKGHGAWKFYNVRGEMTEEKVYVDDEIHGDENFYTDGVKTSTYTYNKGVLVGVTYFDMSGKQLGKYGDPKGNFSVKGFYPTGKRSHEGNFKNGKRSGEWKYYYPEGMLHLVYSWVDGEVHGLYKEFYRTGQLKVEKSFENGDHHGLSREYRIDGTLQEQGWYQYDKAEQTWITYYPNGGVETVNYYREGDLISSIDYSLDQKLYSKFEYKGDLITLVEYYDEDGAPILSLNDIRKDSQGESKYKNGKTQFTFNVDCGFYSGVKRYWPDGKKMLEVEAFEGRRSGLYRSLNEKEQVLTEGNYFQSNETGRWIWVYDNGKLETEGFYVNGDRDSTWSYYNEVGTLTHTVQYMDDERHGISTYNSGNGTKALEKKYRSGDIVEFRVLRNGVMSPWQPFTGNEDMVATLSNGQKIYEEHYKSGLLDGPRTAWYDNGKVAYQYNFSKGLYEGAYVCYYPDGTVSEKGTYKLDEYEGPREQFDEKGKRIRYEEYKMGTRDGKAILSNGQEVRYWNGALVD